MKTIFITSFNPFISRNILATDVFRILKESPDLRVVLFVPDYKLEYFQERYSAPNVIIEGVPTEKISRQDVIFAYLDSSLINSGTAAIHKREKLQRDKNLFKFSFSLALRKFFGQFNWIKQLFRWADLKTISAAALEKYFDRHSPDLLFATDIFNNDDVHFLAAARKRGVKTAGMIRSWDNITTKGTFRIKPDKLIVHNEIIKEEAIRHNVMEPENIFVSGIPQYDSYLKSKRTPREKFFAKIGLDPRKKLVLFSPFGGRFYKYDWQIAEILKELNVQVLMRLTPNDKVDLGRFVPTQLFYVDRPGRQFRQDHFRDAELNAKDMDWLADSLYHSDVVIAGGASIALDAAVFNKPAVLIYFDGFEKNLPYLESAKKWLDFDHAKPVWQSGAAKAARSKEELLEAVRAYLKDPELDREKRMRMAGEQIGRFDGKSGRRIAAFLIENSFDARAFQ